MSQSSPPIRPGEIHAPNPFELYWEKNQRFVIACAVLLIAAIGLYYGVRHFTKRADDERWSKVAEELNLDDAYASTPASLGWVESLLANPQFADQRFNIILRNYLPQAVQALAADLPEHLRAADLPQLERAIAEASDEDVQPLLMWAAAHRAKLDGNFDRAEHWLKELQAKHPNHFLNRTSDYPPQYREDRAKPAEALPGEPPPKHKPDLAPPISGSPVSLVLAQIERARQFRATNPRFYNAPEPAEKPVVVIKTTVGEFKIRLYPDKAPKTVAAFLELAKSDYFVETRVDEIVRPASGGGPGATDVEEFRFGVPSTKNQDDRTKWNPNEPLTEGEGIEQEQNDLSHFPGMVAASPAPSDPAKSAIKRLWVAVTDAPLHDGERVIFGRVVEGMDVLREIANYSFSTADEGRIGRGKPRDDIRITDVDVLE